jgi:DNA topoisomerase IA
MTASMKRHSAARRRTGLSASTAPAFSPRSITRSWWSGASRRRPLQCWWSATGKSPFQKEKYFNVHVGKGDLTADLEKVKTEEEAKRIAAACEKKQAVVSSLKRETKTVNPPKLYDLTTLQREANRYYGFTAQQTLDLVQTLYEKKLLTYPRTDSQFITDDMEDTAVRSFLLSAASFRFSPAFRSLRTFPA